MAETKWPASRLRDPDFPRLLAERHPDALELYWAAAAIWHPDWQALQPPDPRGPVG